MHEAEESHYMAKVNVDEKKKVRWNEASKVNNILASERSRDRLMKHQLEKSQDQARVLRDIEKAHYELAKDNQEALEKREYQKRIF